MSYSTFINNAYAQALNNARNEDASELLRQKRINQAGALTKTILEQLLGGGGSWASGLGSAGATSAVVGSAPAASAPLLSAGGYAAVPAYTAPTYSVAGLGGASASLAGTSAASVGGEAAAAAGPSAGAIAGPVVAGLAVGSSRPGDALFPIKLGMYNLGERLGHRQFREWSQSIQDAMFGKSKRQSILHNMLAFNGPGFFNNIFGEPNQQLQQQQSRIQRLQTLKRMGQLSKINELMSDEPIIEDEG